MNIPTSAALSLVAVYALHRMIEPGLPPYDVFLAFGSCIVIGVAAIWGYIVKVSRQDRLRWRQWSD